MYDGFIGRMINGAFAAWSRNVVNYSILAVVISLPTVAMQYYLVTSAPPSSAFGGQSRLVGWFGLFALNLILGSLLAAAVTYGVLQDLREEHASLGDCLSRGFSHTGSVLGASLIATIAMSFGFLALVIPGLIIMTMLYVAIPVVVMEGVGPMEALQRSSQLTDGAKGSLFVAILGIGIVTLVLAWLAGLVIETVVTEPVTVMVVTEVVGSLFTPLGACAASVGYFLLRQEKEGADLDTLASIFD